MFYSTLPQRVLFVAVIVTALVEISVPAHAQAPAKLLREAVQSGDAAVRLQVVSSRNDAVSGGDALVEVALGDQAVGPIRLSVNGRDVSDSLHLAPGVRTWRALITDLKVGGNRLEARDLGRPGAAARLRVTNYPITGPIIAGPKETPFICMTHLFALPVTGGNLGQALDKDCSSKTRVDYVYRDTAGVFKPFAATRPRPADLATATTLEGRTVPYIVRVETGTADRAIYQFAVLHDPNAETEPTFDKPPRNWNRRVIYQFGGGCPGGYYTQGQNTGGVLDDYLLSKGYAEASSSLNVFGNNCDDLLASEAMMMVKEVLVQRLGPPQFTIGYGCSGGSYQAEQIADNYPGLLDGIIVGCSFPDVGNAAVSVHSFGAKLVYNYFQTADPTLGWTDAQKVAVSGLPDLTSLTEQGARTDRTSPDNCNRIVPEAQRWTASNPTGLRCTIYEHGVNSFGRDPKTGKARRPFDNVGVQYGLAALNEGVISKAQFLDLNRSIGGLDDDSRFVPNRTTGDLVAIRRGYQLGRFLSAGGGLKATPIIDYRAYADFDKGDPHQRFHSFSTRARLIKANGSADNQVMLTESNRYGLFSQKSPVLRGAIDAMDGWLTTLTASSAPRTPQSVVAAKPADLVDACYTAEGERIVETQVYGQETACNRLYPPHANPFIVAGRSVANDIAKCALKPLDVRDYKVAFTPEELAQLRGLFPTGVCDWAKPGVGQGPLLGPWLSLGPAA